MAAKIFRYDILGLLNEFHYLFFRELKHVAVCRSITDFGMGINPLLVKFVQYTVLLEFDKEIGQPDLAGYF